MTNYNSLTHTKGNQSMAMRDKYRCPPLTEDEKVSGIRQLNDKLRIERKGGCTIATDGILALGNDQIEAIRNTIAAYADFTHSNDPYGEHDFGTLTFGENEIIWKIDYLDVNRSGHSPDPSNASLTSRCMTIMLTSEY